MFWVKCVCSARGWASLGEEGVDLCVQIVLRVRGVCLNTEWLWGVERRDGAVDVGCWEVLNGVVR